MRQENLVSVITATYNMARYIGETLDSILGQDYPAVEAIVVDDGSTDDTNAVLSRFAGDARVRIIHQENSGQTVAKNRGIAAARGEFVAFCDADDTWRKDKLSLQIPRFRQDQRVAVVYSEMQCINGNGEPIPLIGPRRRYRGRITAALLIDNFVPFPSAVVRADVMEEMGGFDERLSMSIDYDLWLRIAVKYHFDFEPQPLVNYRVWGGQMSHRTEERLNNFFTLLARFQADHPRAITAAQWRHAWAHVHVTRGHWLAQQGRNHEAWSDYRKAMRYRCYDQRLWRRTISLVCGRDAVRE
jgi:glycosyltransferase involved in cell wall biosynthesis